VGADGVTPCPLPNDAVQVALAAVAAVALQVLKSNFWEALRDNVLDRARARYDAVGPRAASLDGPEMYMDQAQIRVVERTLDGVWDDLQKRLPGLISKRYTWPEEETSLLRVRYTKGKDGPPVFGPPDWHDDSPKEESTHHINILFAALPRGEGGEGTRSGTLFREEAGPSQGAVYQNAAIGDELGVSIFPATSSVFDHAEPFRTVRPAPGRIVVFFQIRTEAYHTPENNAEYVQAVEAIRAALLKLKL